MKNQTSSVLKNIYVLAVTAMLLYACGGTGGKFSNTHASAGEGSGSGTGSATPPTQPPPPEEPPPPPPEEPVTPVCRIGDECHDGDLYYCSEGPCLAPLPAPITICAGLPECCHQGEDPEETGCVPTGESPPPENNGYKCLQLGCVCKQNGAEHANEPPLCGQHPVLVSGGICDFYLYQRSGMHEGMPCVGYAADSTASDSFLLGTIECAFAELCEIPNEGEEGTIAKGAN